MSKQISQLKLSAHDSQTAPVSETGFVQIVSQTTLSTSPQTALSFQTSQAVLPTPASVTAFSTPASLIPGNAEIATQTLNVNGFRPPDLGGGHEETLPTAVGLLLVAMIGLVAVTRRRVSQVGEEQ